jgi:hypothetical protein
MAIEFRKKTVLFTGNVAVEDAEPLLQWLQGKTGVRVDLSICTHVHPANVQVLLAAGVAVSAWPIETGLRDWLQTVLPSMT